MNKPIDRYPGHGSIKINRMAWIVGEKRRNFVLGKEGEVVSSDISRNFWTAAIDPDTRRTHASASLIKFTRPWGCTAISNIIWSCKEARGRGRELTTLAGFRNTVDTVVDLDKACIFLSKLKKSFQSTLRKKSWNFETKISILTTLEGSSLYSLYERRNKIVLRDAESRSLQIRARIILWQSSRNIPTKSFLR